MPVIDDDEVYCARVAGMDISKRDVKVAVRLVENGRVKALAAPLPWARPTTHHRAHRPSRIASAMMSSITSLFASAYCWTDGQVRAVRMVLVRA
jgi:hypothetical protein